MISEMERLILKADVVASKVTPTKATIIARKKGLGAFSAGFRYGSKAVATKTATLTTTIGKAGKTPGKTLPLDKVVRVAERPESTLAPTPTGLLSTAMLLWGNAGIETDPADSETTKESVSAACSDNTSVDDLFDSATAFEIEDPGKMYLKKESSLVHKMYMK
jgi:hypothetical protein